MLWYAFSLVSSSSIPSHEKKIRMETQTQHMKRAFFSFHTIQSQFRCIVMNTVASPHTLSLSDCRMFLLGYTQSPEFTYKHISCSVRCCRCCCCSCHLFSFSFYELYRLLRLVIASSFIGRGFVFFHRSQ